MYLTTHQHALVDTADRIQYQHGHYIIIIIIIIIIYQTPWDLDSCPDRC